MALGLEITGLFGVSLEDCTRVQSTPSQAEIQQAKHFLHARTKPKPLA